MAKFEKWFPKGIHHFFIGSGLTGIAFFCFVADCLWVQRWWFAWGYSGLALIGQLYAWDDLVGDYFHVKTPVKRIDQWVKANVGWYRRMCEKLDKLFGKEVKDV
jgi:hypothetical protein